MKEATPDWTQFRRRIRLEKPPADVYAAWAVPANIEHWFLQRATYTTPEGHPRNEADPVEKGDRFTWKWHNWDFEEKGEILEANGADRLTFTFGAGGNVHLHLRPAGSGTELLLVQDEIPADESGKRNIFVGCATGWTFWLTNLKAWLEYGITLNAKGLSQDETADLVNS